MALNKYAFPGIWFSLFFYPQAYKSAGTRIPRELPDGRNLFASNLRCEHPQHTDQSPWKLLQPEGSLQNSVSERHLDIFTRLPKKILIIKSFWAVFSIPSVFGIHAAERKVSKCYFTHATFRNLIVDRKLHSNNIDIYKTFGKCQEQSRSQWWP